MKKLFLLTLLAWTGHFVCAQNSPALLNQVPITKMVPGEILVRFHDEVQIRVATRSNTVQTGIASIDRILAQEGVVSGEKLFTGVAAPTAPVLLKGYDGRTFERPSLHNIYRLKTGDPGAMFHAIKALAGDPNVIFAEPNYLLSIDGTAPALPPGTSSSPASLPNDPLYSQQTYIPAIHADAVWDSVNGKDSTQIIAILDTGIDWLHPDLSPNLWINPGEIPGNGIDDDGNGYVDDVRGWDFVYHENNPMDDNGHGTHVAGIAAARGNNNIGITGVSPRARIMAVKVFQANGFGDAATIAQGINYAAAAGATILNMSFGTYGRSLTMETALQNAYLTAVLVAAAGNDHKSIYSTNPMEPTLFYPAGLPYVLGVQANADFSNYDPDGPIYSSYADGFNYELTAPGSGLLSTFRNGTYKTMSGTSMAAPCVSGAVALYRAYYPTRSNEELWGDFIHTASGVINIQQAMFNTIKYPVFDLLATTVTDTLPGDDRDGQADAGETIQLWVKIRNTFGPADSAFVKLRPSPYGDTASVQILSDSTYLGGVGTWATTSNQLQPFTVFIKPSAINDQTVQLDVAMKNAGDTAEYVQTIHFKVSNGTELSGLLSQDITLTPDRLWLINNSLRIGTGVTMTILPGTQVHVDAGVDNRGLVYAVGTSDSLVRIQGAIGGNCQYAYVDFNLNGGSLSTNGTISHCHITNGTNIIVNKIVHCRVESITGDFIRADSLIDTEFHNILIYSNFEGKVIRCVLDNLIFNSTMNLSSMKYTVCNKLVNLYRYLYPAFPAYWTPSFLLSVEDDMNFVKNTFITNESPSYFVKTDGGSDAVNFRHQYWGTTDTLKIRQKYYDFWKDAGRPLLIYHPYLVSPSDSCPGHVWKVLVNGNDAQDGTPDPVGVGNVRFRILFNRPMDTTFTPNLSFGVRQPYTQHPVSDSAGWSADRKEWHAVFPVQLFTGDGFHQIRVAGARDPDGMEIPVEDTRFRFNIQAAGSASIDFIARPLIGKIDLEWNNAGISDLLGFNLYRFRNLTDTTFTSPERINTELITDTIYTDFNVNPGQHYWYYYKVVNTDFRESDSSRFADAIPYNTIPGDANGDMAVNVLDITSIIAYIMAQNPQPFLFDAADVNGDHEINILDVIGVVNIITAKKKSAAAGAPGLFFTGDPMLPNNNSRNAPANTLTILGASALPGDTVVITVGIRNTDPFISFQLDLPLPEHTTFIKNSLHLTGRSTNHAVFGSSTDQNLLRIFSYSPDNSSFTGNDGTVVTFRLAVGNIRGEYVLSAQDGIIGNPQSQNMLEGGEDGVLSVFPLGMEEYRPGEDMISSASVYPNPGQSRATLSFHACYGGNLFLRILDMQGKKVKSASLGHFGPGDHELDITPFTRELKGAGNWILELCPSVSAEPSATIHYIRL
ncbi:MAG TPA: S8 family serine peptidase [Bacteroidales bacterium]|nr:S8 family serine peptidase [Bacteroidales bacterium]